jgi:hypothetical protein
MPNPFDPMQLTPRDMLRAAPILKEQAGLDDVDPYDLLDVTGDKYLRRVLVIWCLKSRDNPDLTWDEAFDTPFGDLFDEDEEAEAELDPLPATTPASTVADEPGSEPSNNGGSRKKRSVVTAERKS